MWMTLGSACVTETHKNAGLTGLISSTLITAVISRNTRQISRRVYLFSLWLSGNQQLGLERGFEFEYVTTELPRSRYP